MASSSLDERYLELARSMEIASIPERIRCATCDKLAINAVKLPCCDSPVCGDCQQDKLPTYTECPICMHTPFAADMGAPAKSLQTTVKVFIKNEAKKRGIDLKTGAKIVPETSAPAEPANTANTPAADASTLTPADSKVTPAIAAGETEATEPPNNDDAHDGEAAPTVETQDEPLQSSAGTDEKQGEQDQDDDDDDDDVVITTERPEQEEEQHQQPDAEGELQQYDKQVNGGGESSAQNMQMDNNQQGFGFDQGMAGFGNGNFGNMNMNMSGFNPMMAMSGFGMGMSNMMGVPGMGMDPSMMFGGNFGGMGDMSMMGMGSMGGAMSGMGDFNGMGGPGFFPNQGNYMQSNYGNAHRQNFFNDRGYGRGYGRGFGRGSRGSQYGRGRGGWGFQQQQQYNHNQQYAQQQQVGGPQQSGANDGDVASRRRASPSYETGKGPDGAPATNSGDKLSTAIANADHDAGLDTNMVDDNANQAVGSVDQVMENGDVARPNQRDPNKDHTSEKDGVVDANGDVQNGDDVQMDTTAMQSGSSNDVEHATQYQQQAGNYEFSGRGGYRGGRSGHGFARAQDSTELTPTPAPPINAPTGPKAMRQGLPNTGWAGRALTQTKPTPTPAPELKAPSEPPKDEDRRHEEDRGRSRSRSRSKRRNSRHKERDNGYESDEMYARRKERERRKRKEREERYDDGGAASKDEDKRSKKYRSRSESRTDDSSRRRHRDKEDDYRPSHSRRDRSKDKHRRRHRSRSPANDDAQDGHSRRKSKSHHERDGEHESSDRYKDSKRSSRRHSTRDDDDHHKDDRKDRSHRSSKHDRSTKDTTRTRETERPRAVIEPPSDELGFKIKGTKSAKAIKENNFSMAPPSSSRHESRNSVPDTSTPASADPYAEERARAQQNREAKEAQRRLSSSTTLGKRGREDDETFDAPKGPKNARTFVRKGRRVNYKYEDEVGSGDGDERDAGKWR